MLILLVWNHKGSKNFLLDRLLISSTEIIINNEKLLTKICSLAYNLKSSSSLDTSRLQTSWAHGAVALGRLPGRKSLAVMYFFSLSGATHMGPIMYSKLLCVFSFSVPFNETCAQSCSQSQRVLSLAVKTLERHSTGPEFESPWEQISGCG